MNINELKKISLLKKNCNIIMTKQSSRRERLKPAWKRKILTKKSSQCKFAIFSIHTFHFKMPSPPGPAIPDLSIPLNHTYSGHDKLCELLSWTNQNQPKIKQTCFNYCIASKCASVCKFVGKCRVTLPTTPLLKHHQHQPK